MKRLTPLLMTLALIAVLTAVASGSGGRRTVTVVLNGKTLNFDAAAYLEGGRTMVPLRAVAEALGLTVKWTGGTDTAYLYSDDWSPDLSGRTIVVDPGHGGSATGAAYHGVRESHLNLAIAQKTARALESMGARVVMTRTGDQDVSLPDRAALANRLKADLLLSVHCNSSASNPDARGIYTAHHSASRGGQAAADLLRQTMMASTGAPDMGTHRRDDLAVLRQSRVPAALVECGFMSTPAELDLLQQDAYQQQLARGIAHGAALYLAA